MKDGRGARGYATEEENSRGCTQMQDETRPLFFEPNRPRHSIEMTPWDPTACARGCVPIHVRVAKEKLRKRRETESGDVRKWTLSRIGGHIRKSADLRVR